MSSQIYNSQKISEAEGFRGKGLGTVVRVRTGPSLVDDGNSRINHPGNGERTCPCEQPHHRIGCHSSAGCSSGLPSNSTAERAPKALGAGIGNRARGGPASRAATAVGSLSPDLPTRAYQLGSEFRGEPTVDCLASAHPFVTAIMQRPCAEHGQRGVDEPAREFPFTACASQRCALQVPIGTRPRGQPEPLSGLSARSSVRWTP